MSNEWTDGKYKISWINEDEIKIEETDVAYPHNFAIMCGGDFESILSGLIGSYNSGMGAGLDRAKEILKS